MRKVDRKSYLIESYVIDYENGVICEVNVDKLINEIRWSFEEKNNNEPLYYMNNEELLNLIYNVDRVSFRANPIKSSDNIDDTIKYLEEFDEFHKLYKISPYHERTMVKNYLSSNWVPVIEYQILCQLKNNSKGLGLDDIVRIWNSSPFTITKIPDNFLSDIRLIESNNMLSNIRLYYKFSVEINNELMDFMARDSYNNVSYCDKFLELLEKSIY
jgi:hypothetical protein